MSSSAETPIFWNISKINLQRIFFFYIYILKGGGGGIRPALEYSQPETGIKAIEETLPYQ